MNWFAGPLKVGEKDEACKLETDHDCEFALGNSCQEYCNACMIKLSHTLFGSDCKENGKCECLYPPPCTTQSCN